MPEQAVGPGGAAQRGRGLLRAAVARRAGEAPQKSDGESASQAAKTPAGVPVVPRPVKPYEWNRPASGSRAAELPEDKQASIRGGPRGRDAGTPRWWVAAGAWPRARRGSRAVRATSASRLARPVAAARQNRRRGMQPSRVRAEPAEGQPRRGARATARRPSQSCLEPVLSSQLTALRGRLPGRRRVRWRPCPRRWEPRPPVHPE